MFYKLIPQIKSQTFPCTKDQMKCHVTRDRIYATNCVCVGKHNHKDDIPHRVG